MEAELQTDIVVRPVRDVDAEALGRVHATCWHETYDHLISKAALEKVSPRRMAELWTHWAVQGPEFKMFAALVDGEIVGFAGSGPGPRQGRAAVPRALLHLPARRMARHRHRPEAVRRRRRRRTRRSTSGSPTTTRARTASTSATASRSTAPRTPSRSWVRRSPRCGSSADALTCSRPGPSRAFPRSPRARISSP